MRLFKSHMYYLNRYISSNLSIYLLYFLNISSLSYGYVFSILYTFSVLYTVSIFYTVSIRCIFSGLLLSTMTNGRNDPLT